MKPLRDPIDTELFLLDRIVDLLLTRKATIAATHQYLGVLGKQFLGILPMAQLEAIPVRVASAIRDCRMVNRMELQHLLSLHPRQLLVRRRRQYLMPFPNQAHTFSATTSTLLAFSLSLAS